MKHFRNGFLKGTFATSCTVMFLAALATDVRPVGAAIIFAISATYVGLFMWVNAGRWDGVI